MRISSSRIYENALYAINAASERMNRANRVLASGKQLNAPSDDPAGFAQSLDLRNALDNFAQYGKNVDEARGFLGISDVALSDAGNLLRQARTIAVQSGDGALNYEERQALASQVSRIIEQLSASANATYGSRYVFGGQRTTQAPFVASPGTYVYQGGQAATGDDKLRVEIGPNDLMVMNVSGEKLFTEAFDTLAQLRDHIASGQLTTVSNEDLTALDNAINTVLQARTDVGMKVQRLDQARQRFEQMKVDFTDYLSRIEDADIPTAIVELQTAETAYQAALTAAARGFQQSLLDFLK